MKYFMVVVLALLAVVPANAGVRLVDPPHIEEVLTYRSPVDYRVSAEGWIIDTDRPVLLYGCEDRSAENDIQDVRVVAEVPGRLPGKLYIGIRYDGYVVYYADKELRMSIAAEYFNALMHVFGLNEACMPEH